MRLSELLTALGEVGTEEGEDVEVGGVAVDSRHVRPGDVFFALPGAKSDGRRHIAEAIARGACAVVATGDVEAVKREVTFEKFLTGGDGGASELLAWLVSMGAAAEMGKPKAESVFYVPSVPSEASMTSHLAMRVKTSSSTIWIERSSSTTRILTAAVLVATFMAPTGSTASSIPSAVPTTATGSFGERCSEKL